MRLPTATSSSPPSTSSCCRSAFDALNSAEVERWWGNAPGLYRMQNWQSDPRVGGHWRVDVCFPDGAAAR
jgi:uncharacterized protein YndB with AHSA1/START domain